MNVSQRSAVSAILLVSVFSLLGWWFFGRSEPAPTVAAAAPVLGPDSAAGRPAGRAPAAPVAYTDQTGYVAPDLATATPAEIQAIHDAEARNSAVSQAPRTYRGMDGRPKAFNYNDTRTAAEENVRDIRRQQLMQELARDPRAFAAKYKLSLKEVQWIVDGDTDFPERLLLQ